VQLFGEAKPHPKGQRRNIFGRDDELKVAPKGVGKDHRYRIFMCQELSQQLTNFNNRDIDLLKCRSFAVVHQFVLLSLIFIC
jgi:hypothetical protein